MPDTDVDIFIIGGGINGCGIARDAAGRGYSVALAEMNDLASGTSSWSTKLVHGGLRYLEHHEFRLVREALREREILWANAPHIIHPLRFVLPHDQGMRPAWLLRLGLFLYDHIGGRKRLAPTRSIDLSHDEAGPALQTRFARAFEYSDCWVDDARLVVLNARDARNRGARIATRSRVTTARRDGGSWLVTRQDASGRHTTRARLLVNAAGPWVDEVLRSALGRPEAHHVRLVQGSHIVIRRKFAHGRAYIFQNPDGRIFFAIPFEEDFTLIGTTDRDWKGSPDDVKISQGEIDYLRDGASACFREPVRREDIVWTYSGVRPLFDDGASKAQEATRDYVLAVDAPPQGAPLINIFGGKITTYRRLAEAVLAEIAGRIGQRGASWTGSAPLPGGDFPVDGRAELVRSLRAEKRFVNQGLATRLVRQYGTHARSVVGDVTDLSGLGRLFGADLHQREVEWLMGNEWAATAEDVLWRRTKLGLRFSAGEAAALDAFMRQHGRGGGREAAA